MTEQNDKSLENKVKKYQIIDWVPIIGPLRLMYNNERWDKLNKSNYGDFLYLLANFTYGMVSSAAGLFYLLLRE
jgi:hypothetical protein